MYRSNVEMSKQCWGAGHRLVWEQEGALSE